MSNLTTRSTSYNSAEVEQVLVIDETSTTRRVFRAVINDVKMSSGETVSGTIIHQRKSRNNAWEDIEAIDLTTLKAGEGVKIHLKSTPLKKFYDGLKQLYCLSQKGVMLGEREFVVEEADKIMTIPENRRLFVQKLLEQDLGEEIWEELVDSNPDLVTRLSRARIQHERSEALTEFENSLNGELDESYWQKFFQNNQWIFGYGLNYQFLSEVSDQPHFGGINFTGIGAQRGDYLLSSNAAAKFTCIVEIKKPTSRLLSHRKSGEIIEYRNDVCLISPELAGGIAQVQANCKTWQNSALESKNDRVLHKLNIHTIQPKGILVIGNTEELTSDSSIETFELCRRNLHNPEIITFDELLERARFIVTSESNTAESELKEQNDVTF